MANLGSGIDRKLCVECNGRGWVYGNSLPLDGDVPEMEDCHVCDGEGLTPSTKRIHELMQWGNSVLTTEG